MAPLEWKKFMKLQVDDLEDDTKAEDMFEALVEVGQWVADKYRIIYVLSWNILIT